MAIFGKLLGRNAQQIGRLIGRNGNTIGRQIANTANQIAKGLDTAQRVVGAVEKASGNPALSVVSGALRTAGSGARVVGDVGNVVRGVSNGNAGQTLQAGNSLLNNGSRFTSGVVQTGLPLMLL